MKMFMVVCLGGIGASFAASAAAVPAPSELLFVPYTSPCRIFDSRRTTGPLASGQARNVFINALNFNYTTQGGNGACSPPTTATAVAVTITTVGSPASGNLTAEAGGTNPSASTIVSFSPTIPQNGAANLALNGNSISLYATGSNTHAIVDINGYYIPQIHARINADGTAYSLTPRIIDINHLANSGSYVVRVDRSITACAISTTGTDRSTLVSSFGSSNAIQVYTQVLSGGSFVTVDRGFDISVHC